MGVGGYDLISAGCGWVWGVGVSVGERGWV